MVDWSRILLMIGLFVAGGLLSLALKPFIMLAAIGLLLMAVFIIIFAILPGGWFLSYLGGRMFGAVLFTRFGLALLLVILGYLGGLALGDWVLFTAGGLALILLIKPPAILSRRGQAFARQREAEKVVEARSGNLIDGKAVTLDNVESGIIVTGEESVEVGRLLIHELRRLGRKIIVVGESSKLIPDGSGKVVAAKAYSFDVVQDLLRDPRAAEAFTYAFTLANKLENDDIPLIQVAVYNVVRDLQAGNISRDEAVKSIPEQIQDRRGNLIKNILSLCSFIGSKGISYTSLGDDWDIVYISVKDLPQRHTVFAIAYSIYMLSRHDAVLVLHNPEKLLPDINLLAYNARESWERAFNTLSLHRERGLGLILISRSPIASQYLLKLCPSIIATRMPEVNVGRLEDEHLRNVVKIARTIKPGELIASTSDKLVKMKYKAPKPANLPPPKPSEKPVEAVAQAVGIGQGQATEKQAGAKIELTALEREFGEKAIDAARIIQSARSGLPEVLGEDAEVAGKLEGKGYLTRFGGVYYPSSLGLELLEEYQKAVKERGLITTAQAAAPSIQEPAEEPTEAKQTIIDYEAALDRLGEHSASYRLAESLFRQGKYAQSVMKAYEFMVNSLKAFYNIEKGHLDDIVEMLESKGVKTIGVNEAKDAKTLLIEASNALKDGKQVPLTSAQRMLRYARRVLESLSEQGGGGNEG